MRVHFDGDSQDFPYRFLSEHSSQSAIACNHRDAPPLRGAHRSAEAVPHGATGNVPEPVRGGPSCTFLHLPVFIAAVLLAFFPSFVPSGEAPPLLLAEVHREDVCLDRYRIGEAGGGNDRGFRRRRTDGSRC